MRRSQVGIGPLAQTGWVEHHIHDDRQQRHQADGDLAQHVIREKVIRFSAGISLQRRDAVQPDEQDVHPDKQDEKRRDDTDVKVVEARKRVWIHVGPAAK